VRGDRLGHDGLDLGGDRTGVREYLVQQVAEGRGLQGQVRAERVQPEARVDQCGDGAFELAQKATRDKGRAVPDLGSAQAASPEEPVKGS